MATANAIMLRQRKDQIASDAHKRTLSEAHKLHWKTKTDVLANRANMRYD